MTESGPARPPRVPERQCVACRTLVPRIALLRLVRQPDGEVHLDQEHRRQGRGAYVCRTPACVQLAARKGGLQRALRKPVPQHLMEIIVALGTTPGSATTMDSQGS